ncbi:hypothetical protein NKJ02_06695 [Mesorhizobium sp. M0213]
MMLDADLVLTLEQRVAGQRSHGRLDPVETDGIFVGTADAIAKVAGIVRVHWFDPFPVPGIWLGACVNADSILDLNGHVI